MKYLIRFSSTFVGSFLAAFLIMLAVRVAGLYAPMDHWGILMADVGMASVWGLACAVFGLFLLQDSGWAWSLALGAVLTVLSLILIFVALEMNRGAPQLIIFLIPVLGFGPLSTSLSFAVYRKWHSFLQAREVSA